MSEKGPVVHVIDDDPSVRSSLTRLLQASGYEPKTYASAREFLAREFDDRGGCVVLDLHMPAGSGLDLQESLAVDPAALPIIFLTGHADVRTSVRAMKAGAIDFLAKPVLRDELLAAIERALAHDEAMCQARSQQRQLQSCVERLTQREREVFRLVVSGTLNKQIARQLGTTERTIKAHRAQVMHKLEVQSVADLVRFAIRLGLTEAQNPGHSGVK